MPREMPSKVASTASPAARLLILALFATASTRSPFVMCVHLLPGDSLWCLNLLHAFIRSKARIFRIQSKMSTQFFQPLVKQTVAHPLVADDDLLDAQESHDSFNHGGARENDVGSLGLKAGDGFSLSNGFPLKKVYLTPDLA